MVIKKLCVLDLLNRTKNRYTEVTDEYIINSISEANLCSIDSGDLVQLKNDTLYFHIVYYKPKNELYLIKDLSKDMRELQNECLSNIQYTDSKKVVCEKLSELLDISTSKIGRMIGNTTNKSPYEIITEDELFIRLYDKYLLEVGFLDRAVKELESYRIYIA